MAFDQTTRNRLARFVSDTRALLTEEFTRQLQNDYGLDPATGEVTDVARLSHLDDARRETARLLRDTMEHYLASADTATPAKAKKARQDVLDRILREQAFTVLNRLCALRMAEARGLLIESIAKGYQSKGFQLYQRLAGTALGETGAAYRLFLFSVFDEFAVDLAVLFDRFSPQGRLFPREAALLAVLEQVNHPDIDLLWTEDETIGWIYQYFNSLEERRQMRAESQAPRNSRELAVRNQFFTPRYVVEFLTDNTLGRIWYEMTKGETGLKDSSRYLVRRPNEVFLVEGQEVPDPDESTENMFQEELLRQTVHIPHRPLKDPRDIRMLDPACGSMHFGLYAFDLFERIYDEAWEIEAARGPGAFTRSKGLNPFTETYACKEAFLRDVPRLIIECNIHGIDIDPRAVQIAGLSLWLRAQKSWQAQHVKAQDRPQVQRSNIVCAEPMPGEADMLEEFAEKLQPKVLGQLVRIIFEKMKLAGEAGSLLKIEADIKDAIADAHNEYQKFILQRKKEKGFLPGMAPERQATLFDFADLPKEEDFWRTAEQRVIDALRDYAESASANTYQHHLFATDAARGFAFIDLCRKRYDVVVMNPPFGEPAAGTVELLKHSYGDSSSDIDAAFVDRGSELLVTLGSLGGIYNRTQFFKGYLEAWRKNNLLHTRQIASCADLGYGVLDGAMVEAVSYTTTFHHKDGRSWFSSSLSATDKQSRLEDAVDALLSGCLASESYYLRTAELTKIPASRISYWIAQDMIDSFTRYQLLENNFGHARQGLITADNERFLRLAWEVNRGMIGSSEGDFSGDGDRGISTSKKWCYYAKGGEYSPYYGDIHLLVLWENSGKEICNFRRNGKLASRPQNISFYFRPAITYTERTASDFSPRVMPSGCIFDCKGPIVAAANEGVDLRALLGLLNSSIFKYFVELSLAAGDSSVSGSAARQYTQSIVGQVPVPDGVFQHDNKLGELAEGVWKALCSIEMSDETSVFFSTLWPGSIARECSVSEGSRTVSVLRDNSMLHVLRATYDIEVIISGFYDADKKSLEAIERICGAHPESFKTDHFLMLPEAEQRRLLTASPEELVGEFRGDSGSRAITKMSHQADRQVEILAHSFETPASLILKARSQLKNGLQSGAEQMERIASFCFGCVMGRWDIRYATSERHPPELPDPFDPLPICPPGMLQNSVGLPAEPKDVPADYPLRISWPGILVDDESHPEDLAARVREAIEVIWRDRAEAIEEEACEILSVKTLREYFQRPASFFADHLSRYSKSRRVAPIYWPLSTPSGSYTLWLYYHRLTDQTPYTCVNDFVEPKLKQVAEEAARLRTKSARSSSEEKDLERLSSMELELRDFRDELLRIARFWKPNLNDGVQITAAPLWRLFQHKPWQRTLKDAWEKLEAGDYDWAHLALPIWPDRVVRASHKDRSYAIAHDLEDRLWHEVEVEKVGRGGRVTTTTEWQPRALTEADLKTIIAEVQAR